MESFVCRIYRLRSGSTAAIIMTPSLMSKLGCTNGSSVRLSCGSKEVISRITASRHKSGDTIYVPANVANALALPTAPICRLSFQGKTLRMGPVIGILTTGFAGSSVQPFGNRTSLFKQFLVAGREEGPFLFVFTPAMINWRDETITGWHIRYDPTLKKHIWKSERTPLPDVVYDRIPNRQRELLPSVVRCKERLLKHRHPVHWFNQGFFNKWDIHEQLYTHPLVSNYIPETVYSPHISKLQEMLERHQMIYLKPSGGSLGIGIIRITYERKKGCYYCRYHALQSQRNVLKRFTSLNKLLAHVFAGQPARFDKYIAQQGIRLIRHENRPVDFRLHMHKGRHNQWKVIGIAAKIAGLGSVTTHVRTGGSVIPADELYRSVYGAYGPRMQHELERAAVEIAIALEETTPGTLGELGMDLGLDTRHRVWMFEINAKPGRHIFHHPRLRASGEKSARYITEYSMRLADFI